MNPYILLAIYLVATSFFYVLLVKYFEVRRITSAICAAIWPLMLIYIFLLWALD
jgi:hypothetical protein